MERKKIIAANWKMNHTLETAASWFAEISDVAPHFESDIILFPSTALLGDLMNLYEGDKILFGAQNCSEHEKGAYTGEVSAEQLYSIGVDYVLVGHSERRQYFGETNQMISSKIKTAIKNSLTPVFCCGETLEARKSNSSRSAVELQLKETLSSLSEKEASELIIAYEPVWAIGTGLNATPEQAEEMHAFIRTYLSQNFNKNIADSTPILYGGSCKPENASDLFNCPNVDGGLIGGASLKAEDFIALLEIAK